MTPTLQTPHAQTGWSQAEYDQHLQNAVDLFNSRYQTSNLVDVDPAEFQAYIQSRLGTEDASDFRADELDRQREKSIRFTWGHNHDFGDFSIEGDMRNRHLEQIAIFATAFGQVDPSDFDGADVLDIGCWTGGTSLMLAALGANVYAIEEVSQYADMANYLARSFGVASRLQCFPKSLYQLNDEAQHDQYDIVYFPGVLYHLSDPVLALRILYNTCRIGGRILLETFSIRYDKSICLFQGNKGIQKDHNGSIFGFNFFVPSHVALANMLAAAGFQDIHLTYRQTPHGLRLFACAEKNTWQPICKAGLSVPDIK